MRYCRGCDVVPLEIPGSSYCAYCKNDIKIFRKIFMESPKENKMKTYPLIQKLGLKTFSPNYISRLDDDYLLSASDLEDILKTAQRVYGYIGEHGNSWSDSEPGTYIQEKLSHTALLIAVEPIVKGVRKSEIIELLEERVDKGDSAFENMIERIKNEGIINE
jgi:hypothetical protein